MKITHDIINKIFNNQLILKNKKDIIKLSKFNEIIPMFDIYSMKIYPIKNTNIHFRMIDCHYRFINQEIVDWISNMIKKDKNNTELKNNLAILNNYHIETLYETSIKAFFKFSPKFGLEISICKRNSFHPKMIHITPYYSKKELIKLGQNMNQIKDKTFDDLLDRETHYRVCKQISKNDISIDTIIKHSNFIVDNDLTKLITYYSLNGSFLMNKLLRDYSSNSKYYFPEQIKNINKLINSINQSPSLPKDYYFYRFIWEDDFLSKLQVGDTFIDNGFTSTTRDPFYSPGTDYNFGLVLLKINVPKNVKGVGLFIENFSLFPIEEEFLLPPGSKLKLISKNNNFTYHHINPKFERLVKKKYEFTWVGKKTIVLKDVNKKLELITVTKNSDIDGDTIIERQENLIKKYALNFHLKIDNYILQINWFDGTSSYKDFYYNNNSKGLILNLVKDNNILTSIECGDKMIVNYLLTKYYNTETKILMDLYFSITKILGYKEFIIYDTFENYSKTTDIFKVNKKFNRTFVDYLKNNKYNLSKYQQRLVGNLKLNIFLKKVNVELNKKYGKSDKLTFGELYLDVKANNYFYLNKLHIFMKDSLGDEIFQSKVNAKQYWNDLNEDFINYDLNINKETEYDTSFNRRRTR